MSKLISFIKEKFLTPSFIIFGIIGVLNTLVDNGLYVLFIKGGWMYQVANIAAMLISMEFCSYPLNMTFSMKEKMSLKSFLAFPISYIPGMLIQILIVFLVVEVFKAPEVYGKIIALPIYFPVNYLCMNFIVKKFAKK
ncbi:MAG: GtrA family protein [Erysipelotrichaceae bacterium]|nr:GtrA family protein [Erysipelotrichaceae bacterium]